MSYLSGLAIGLSAGKQLHQLFSGKTTPSHTVCQASQPTFMAAKPSKQITLVHALPHRRRYQSAMFIHNTSLRTAFLYKLQALPFITSVEINSYTGSLLLTYTCSSIQIDNLMDYLEDKFFGPSRSVSQSEAGLQIRNLFINLDRFIQQMTNYHFDLRSLIASIFITRGINKVLTLKQYPSGPQMLWWAYTLLRGWVIK